MPGANSTFAPHEDGHALFHTRWAMSYLPGPLTRDQISVLTADDPALEQAASGQKILCASYGDGAHALLFETTDAIEKLEPRVGVEGHLAKRIPLGSYDAYLRSRKLDPKEWESGAGLGLSATIRYRERDADIAMLGARCPECGQPFESNGGMP